MPLYSEFGLLDDRLIESYNSDTQQYLPKAEWMKKLGPEYWKRELQRSRRSEPVFRHRVMTLMKRFNQTGGFHIVQRMYGCELRDDGSTMGYNQHRYDGRDFIYLDTQRWIWVPAMYEAQITTQRWNSPEEKVGELWKNYLQNQCIEDLKQFIEYGREDVEKKVRPEVKVWGRRHSNGVTKLQCLVYGFHPRAVDVKWVRNGVDHLPSDEMSPILPHPDGTYQIRVTAEVPTKEGDTYSCHVDHSSLEEILTEKWNSHSLRYYYTGVSAQGSGIPEFSVVAYVDNQQIVYYNSNSRKVCPVASWMNKVGSEYWEVETQVCKVSESIFKYFVSSTMTRLNQTGGFHFFQDVYGCELRDDGSVTGFDQLGYDGRDFIYLDTQNWLYIPVMNEAQITTQLWNSPESREGEKHKIFVENKCIEYLKKHIDNGREELEKRVRPDVKVWGRQQSDGVTRLQCLVYGFHPRAVDVKWVRNGVDHLPSEEMTPILPHPDGTYQIRVTAEVLTTEGDTYSCHVDHSSLEEILTVKWKPHKGPISGMVVAVAISCFVVAIIIGGLFVYKKRKTGYKSTNNLITVIYISEALPLEETLHPGSDANSHSSNSQ
ncbi:class I histocompatibility antigen, F10 alpha chain-like [Mantella aurantiaca]